MVGTELGPWSAHREGILREDNCLKDWQRGLGPEGWRELRKRPFRRREGFVKDAEMEKGKAFTE